MSEAPAQGLPRGSGCSVVEVQRGQGFRGLLRLDSAVYGPFAGIAGIAGIAGSEAPRRWTIG